MFYSYVNGYQRVSVQSCTYLYAYFVHLSISNKSYVHFVAPSTWEKLNHDISEAETWVNTFPLVDPDSSGGFV